MDQAANIREVDGDESQNQTNEQCQCNGTHAVTLRCEKRATNEIRDHDFCQIKPYQPRHKSDQGDRYSNQGDGHTQCRDGRGEDEQESDASGFQHGNNIGEARVSEFRKNQQEQNSCDEGRRDMQQLGKIESDPRVPARPGLRHFDRLLASDHG